jgi:hypothetical protein
MQKEQVIDGELQSHIPAESSEWREKGMVRVFENLWVSLVRSWEGHESRLHAALQIPGTIVCYSDCCGTNYHRRRHHRERVLEASSSQCQLPHQRMRRSCGLVALRKWYRTVPQSSGVRHLEEEGRIGVAL